MKDIFCTAVGFAAGMISWVVGGFDTPILALILCMAVDYVTGLIVAGVFHTSPKTKGGGLDSRVGWKGLARKFVTLLIVVVANLADVLLPLAPDPVCSRWNEELLSRYAAAEAVFPEMLSQLQAHLTYSGPFGEEFAPIFG